ncbi:ImmA/IrrE family metallo-endopeptidase [Paenibacillus odorifer]|uniref:ImmA/IrrE family metallo-endopeptidase n=1 Tax=Paenibacillus odorifer TaxID=189426 RepID=UPI002DB8F855|nr:ImmA/IrrE family metallo-endopeptidase [Paenibacillus odorifer]MEC0131485.1 ImmA/IrrE family metallo-endopeptidase [Paenibacillus odorifer]MEC0220362.1 ImmA/IrrE family metallo-endopeptidase [Paenibacillus odorifer]
MDFTNYFKTPLEQWIEEQYRTNDVLMPQDLDIDRIAMIFGVEIVYYDNSSFSDNEDKVIFIDRRHERTEQRKAFFHELCHVIRHSGDQRWMPETFREAQENDANRFALYAAIPFFMIEQVQLPINRSEVISLLVSEFQTYPDFAELRFKQVEERISDSKFTSAFTYDERILSNHEITISEPSNSGLDYLQQPRIHSLYGLEDFSRPQALVIEQRQGFNWNRPFHLNIERNYKLLSPSFYHSRHDATVLPGDLSVPPNQSGYVTINLSRVAWRHGQEVTRLILPMEAIDDAINF